MQAAGDREGTTETYLKADGPIPVSIEGIEEEVRIGGGIWGSKEGHWLGCLGVSWQSSPHPRQLYWGSTCVLSWGPPSNGIEAAQGLKKTSGGGNTEVEVRVPSP